MLSKDRKAGTLEEFLSFTGRILSWLYELITGHGGDENHGRVDLPACRIYFLKLGALASIRLRVIGRAIVCLQNMLDITRGSIEH